MDRELVVRHLLNIRESVNIIVGELAEEEEPECAHPIDARIDYSTMGNEWWICELCGYEYRDIEED